MTKAEELLKTADFSKLTPEEIEIVREALKNPLSEFINREAAFRGEQIFNLSGERLDERLSTIADAIADYFNYNEELYDQIDSNIWQALEEYEDNLRTISDLWATPCSGGVEVEVEVETLCSLAYKTLGVVKVEDASSMSEEELYNIGLEYAHQNGYHLEGEQKKEEE